MCKVASHMNTLSGICNIFLPRSPANDLLVSVPSELCDSSRCPNICSSTTMSLYPSVHCVIFCNPEMLNHYSQSRQGTCTCTHIMCMYRYTHHVNTHHMYTHVNTHHMYTHHIYTHHVNTYHVSTHHMNT